MAEPEPDPPVMPDPTPAARTMQVAADAPGTFLLDPDAVLDFAQSWVGWLGDTETVASHTVVGENVTVDSSSEAAGVVTVWVSAAEPRAAVTVRITTNQGRTDDRTMRFIVVDR